MGQDKRVKIDAFAEGVWRCRDFDAIVCVDVITAGTTLVTSMAHGRRTFALPPRDPVAGSGQWLRVDDVEFIGRDGNDDVLGPRDLENRPDRERPLALRSSLDEVLAAAPPDRPLYVACLRNLSATVTHVAAHHDRVAIVAAGVGGESRFEDEMVAARIAGDLRAAGYAAEDRATAVAIERWRRGDVSLIGLGKSAERLRTLGLQAELAFITTHVDDVPIPCRLLGSELSAARPEPVSDLADGEEAAWMDAPPLEQLRAS